MCKTPNPITMLIGSLWIFLLAGGARGGQTSETLATEVSAYGAATLPKFRVKNGHAGRSGQHLFSRHVDGQQHTFSYGGALRLQQGRHQVQVDAWRTERSLAGSLDREIFFDGATVPIGTAVDGDVSFERASLDWSYTFHPAPSLSLETGLSLEHIRFDADFGFGRQVTEGVYPSPQVRASWSLSETIALNAGIGGWMLPFEDGRTSIVDPYEYEASLSWQKGAVRVEAGYNLYHLHLEEDSEAIDEEIVHLRLRSPFLQLGYRF